MKRVRYAPSAQRDIDRIWEYSAENWGKKRANEYIRSVQVAVGKIAKDLDFSTSAEEYRPGYRKLVVESHFIFFKEEIDGLIVVVRVLHQSMDIERQLGA